MSKKIMLVYQDCPMCGAREGWGEEQTKLADNYGLEIINTPFYKAGVKDLIWKACKAGMTLPFFTDGEKFSKNLRDFKEPDFLPEDVVEKPKTKKRSKKHGAKK